MDEEKEPLKDFNDDIEVKNCIFAPLTMTQRKGRKFIVINQADPEVQEQNCQLQDQQKGKEKVLDQVKKDQKLKMILNKETRKKPRSLQIIPISNQLTKNQYSFNFDRYLTFEETPNFKKLLFSPLTKFRNQYKDNINQLKKNTACQKQKFKQIQLNTNPLLYQQQPSTYFYGIIQLLKNKGAFYEALFFYHLTIYLEPFNSKIWEEYCQCLSRIGYWRESAIIAKTGFFFNSSSLSLGQQYLLCAQKSGFAFHQIRGLLSSLQQPQKYEKIILQSARIQMKNRKLWRGFNLLYNYCKIQNYKSILSKSIILLIKILQIKNDTHNIQMLLNQAINQKPAKYQSFNLYIQIQLRLNNGKIKDQKINYLQKRIKNLANQTKYRIYIDLAQAVKYNSNLRNKFYKEAVSTVQKNCKEEVNKKRAYRHIFLSILSKLSIQPEPQIMIKFKYDDHLLLLSNKARFVRGQPLQIYEFQDWKYCLHYCLQKNVDILKKYYKTFNQGRVLAEYFHALRLKQKPLNVLGLWRNKIDECPKSGELWCEGGRIYVELKEYANAQKCFFLAIHFTPQYGDSFFELLKVFWIQNRLLEIHQLFKNFIVSQPFYGNVFSYLRSVEQERLSSVKLSLNKIWERCREQIKKQIYKKQQKVIILTCCNDYNQDFSTLSNKRTRERLFQSYELIQNKFSK